MSSLLQRKKVTAHGEGHQKVTSWGFLTTRASGDLFEGREGQSIDPLASHLSYIVPGVRSSECVFLWDPQMKNKAVWDVASWISQFQFIQLILQGYKASRRYWVSYPAVTTLTKKYSQPRSWELCFSWWANRGLQAQEAASQVTLRKLLLRSRGGSLDI